MTCRRCNAPCEGRHSLAGHELCEGCMTVYLKLREICPNQARVWADKLEECSPKKPPR
jgi:hypothetical protein